MVVMGYIKFEDQALIERWWVGDKINEMGGKFKYEKKQRNCQKLYLFFTRSCEHFQSFGDHRNMSVDNVIGKLQRITKEKEAQKSEHRRRQEEEVNLLRRKEV